MLTDKLLVVDFKVYNYKLKKDVVIFAYGSELNTNTFQCESIEFGCYEDGSFDNKLDIEYDYFFFTEVEEKIEDLLFEAIEKYIDDVPESEPVILNNIKQ